MPMIPVTVLQAPGSNELTYAEATSQVAVTATTEATANTLVTAASLPFDGSTVVYVEFFSPIVRSGTGTNATIVVLYDDSTSLGWFCQTRDGSASGGPIDTNLYGIRRLTPSAATHTYSARAWCPAGNGIVFAGSGGNGNIMPMFIRIRNA